MLHLAPCSLKHSIERWRIVFLSTAAIISFGNTAFLLFGSASVQPWNTYWEEQGSKDEEEEMGNRKSSLRVSEEEKRPC